MKRTIINFITFHLLPIVIGIIFTGFLLTFLQKKAEKDSTVYISGTQKTFRGRLPNFEGGNQSELELAGSLQNENYITFLGSSEFTDSPYCPYNFFPDSLNTPSVGFGHAYMQSFSIFCELMAMQKNLNNSKICIILSPGWFETGGSNIEAFLEFIRPNFLKSIKGNDEIPIEYKKEIGRFIALNIDNIDKPSKTILYFKNLNDETIVDKKLNLFYEEINQYKEKRINKKLNYSVNTITPKLSAPKKINWNKSKNHLQRNFIASIKTNSLFINDEYYNLWMLDSNKVYHHGFNYKVNLKENQEFKDFKLLVDLLKRYNCKASFIMQPLNPYHFTDLANYKEVMDSVNNILIKSKFPYLNLFTAKKEKYEPGTLTDVMHFGDYGWMKVNEFVANTYKK
jgi:D-alanine transfer protein